MGELKPTELKGSRIQLRSFKKGDAVPLFNHYFGSSSSSKFLTRQPYKSIEQVEDFLNQWTRNAWNSPGSPFAWVISEIVESEPIGIFLVFPKKQEVEIHYGISEMHTGRGYASEACDLATAWLLEQSGIEQVQTAVDIEHFATRRVLEKSGFRKKEILKNWLVLPAFGPASRDAILYQKNK
jgi:RimJ/RimL family protein N-acetyltransferase